MKNYLKIICLLACSIFFFNDLHAQTTIGAQVRPRGEFRNGFKTLTDDTRDPAFFIEQRARLFANYKASKFELHINFQDVRIWGNTDQIYKTDESLTNLYEGWAKYHFNEHWSLKIGRQALDYDNARFFGNLDWAQQGRSHDALLFTYKNDSTGLKLDAGLAFNQNGNEPSKLFETFYDGSNYKAMQFIWLHKTVGSGKVSFLVQNDGRQVASDSTSAYRQTLAALGSAKVGGMNLNGEFYYQTGKNTAKNDISAFLLALNATFQTSITPITIGLDYLSGTSINDSKDKSFNPLYGTNHKFYGFMDYFYVGNFHGQQGNVAGLLDVYAKANFKLGEKSSLQTHFHLFNSAADLYDLNNVTQSIDKYLGSELDLVFTCKLDKNVTLNLGYSQMFASESMEHVKTTPGDHSALNNWAWFMINFNPIIFSSDK